MISLGLIGYPLSHSLSPRLHAAAFRAMGVQGEYRLYPIPPDDMSGLARLAKRIREGELRGLNVTIPHKQSILPLVDELTASASAIGAVNTLVLKKDKLIGDNTDSPGFLSDLHGSVPDGFRGKKAIVLGAGGAARAVVSALLGDGWHITLAVRSTDLEQGTLLISSIGPHGGDGISGPVLLDAAALRQYSDEINLVVNATPVGMLPGTSKSPWPDGLLLPSKAVVYDLVYNPRETALLQQARQVGLPAISGIGMLVEQAALSFEIWTGFSPPRDLLFTQVEAV